MTGPGATLLLVARDASRGPARFRPLPGSQRVGRDPASDLPISDATVSRRHAVLRTDGARLEVEDLGSAGGTWVNDSRIGRCPLTPGDVVRFGPRVEYEVAQEEDAASASLALDLTQLRRAVETRAGEAEDLRQLQTLIDVARALNAATVLDEVLQVVLQAAVRLVAAERGTLVLLDASGERRVVASFPAGGVAPVGLDLLERAMAERRILAGASAAGEQVACPLLVARRPLGSAAEASFAARVEGIGALLLERRAGAGGFPPSALGVLESLSGDAAAAIDGARLYREAREKAKIEHEMGLARGIQAALLTPPPRLPFAEVFAHTQPARTVGGDLWFTAARADGALGFALGDVSGKGVAAALWMSLAQGLLGLLHDLGQGLDEMLPALDRSLRAKNPGNRFMTMAAALLAPDGTLRLASAGHCPIALRRGDGGLEMIAPTGPLLGLLPAARWTVVERRLAPGDCVVFYSDGITESESPAGVEFDVAGVRRALAGEGAADAASLGRRLLDAASLHRAGREPGDDLTLLVVRYLGPIGAP